MVRIGTDWKHAAALLMRGALVALPTETVYGLAGRSDDPTVLRRIYAAKNRPGNNPLILHCANLDMVREVAHLDGEALQLAEAFWPGPLTLLLPRREGVLDEACAGLPRVAVRIPDSEQFRAVIAAVGVPLAAPSANMSGYVSPTRAEHVLAGLGTRVDHILDGGPCTAGIESTIVGWNADGVGEVYRLGALTQQVLADQTGRPYPLHQPDLQRPEAPGALAHHYAPHTPVCIDLPQPGDAWVTWSERAAEWSGEPGVHHHRLSATGDLAEAARNLYAALIELDGSGVKRICIEPFPESGLGEALRERVQRAAARPQNSSAA